LGGENAAMMTVPMPNIGATKPIPKSYQRS
jgi:hypothetical protein